MKFSSISLVFIGPFFLSSFICNASKNDGHSAVANEGDTELGSTSLADLMSVTCDQLWEIQLKKIKELQIIPDLHIKMKYSYYRQDCWTQHFPLCETKLKQQSPININTNKIQYYDFPPLILNNANVTMDYGMMGNLISIAQFRVADDLPLSISGGPISEGVTLPFFAMFIFTNTYNNGTPNCHGSLHAINGERYEAELMLVWTERKTSKMTDMLYHKAGKVLSTSWMIQIQEDDNPAWNAMTMPFSRGDACPIKPQDFAGFRYSSLLSLLPSTNDWLNHYYTYDGTAPAPPCMDFKFIIFADPIYVSQAQLSTLQSLKDINEMKVSNVRDLQPVRDSTKVYATIGCHSARR